MSDHLEHIKKLNNSLQILGKVIDASGSETFATSKAIKALAQVQIRICNALIFIIFDQKTADKNEPPYGKTFNAFMDVLNKADIG